MQAMVYDDYGDASVLHAAEIPPPERLPGQILIEMHALSVNPIDYRLRRDEGSAAGRVPAHTWV